jgi:hypothetical protein
MYHSCTKIFEAKKWGVGILRRVYSWVLGMMSSAMMINVHKQAL